MAAPALVEAPAPTVTTIAVRRRTAPEPAPFTYPTSPDQWFAPSGGNHGTEGLALFLAGIALKDNAPLYISEQQSHTTGSPNSDHFTPGPTHGRSTWPSEAFRRPPLKTHLAAKRISAALGEPNWAGGDLTKTINGYRIPGAVARRRPLQPRPRRSAQGLHIPTGAAVG